MALQSRRPSALFRIIASMKKTVVNITINETENGFVINGYRNQTSYGPCSSPGVGSPSYVAKDWDEAQLLAKKLFDYLRAVE